MAIRFKYSPQFRAEYRDALRYIRKKLQNPIAAKNLMDTFTNAKRTLAAFPCATLPSTIGGETYYHVRVKNYLAFYVVQGDTVEFRRFLYARADMAEKF